MASIYLRYIQFDNDEYFKKAIHLMKKNRYFKKNGYNKVSESLKEESWRMYNVINDNKGDNREKINKVIVNNDIIKKPIFSKKMNKYDEEYNISIHNNNYSDALKVKRKQVVDKIKKIYIKHFEDVDFNKWSNNTEKSIYNYSIIYAKNNHVSVNWENKKFRTIYYSNALKIISNLSITPNSPKVRGWLLSKEVKPEKLAFMTSDELHPEYAAETYQRWREKIDFKMNLDDCADGMYQCKKCMKWKTTFTEVQTRSADEPMTVFLSCLTCHHRWRM